MKILELTNFSSGGCGVSTRAMQEAELFAKVGHEVIVMTSNIEKGTDKIMPSVEIIHCQQDKMGGENSKGIYARPEDAVTSESVSLTTAVDSKPLQAAFHTPADIKVFRYPAKKLGGESFMSWFKGEAINKALHFAPDIIIAHNYRHSHTTRALKLAKVIRQVKPCKVFLVTHAPFGNSLRTKLQTLIVNLYDMTIGRRTLKKFDKILAISHWEIPYLIGLGVKESNIVYSPNGILSEFFDLPSQAEEQNKILFLGRISPKKKIETLIAAIPYITDKTIHIEIVGPAEPAYLQKITKLIAELGVGDRITFTPAIYDLKEKISKMDSAKIYVLASNVEGMPQGIIEVMAREKTVIGSNSLALRDIISDAKNGYLFQPDNYISLAEKINFAMEHPIDGRESVRKFNWNIQIEEMKKLL
jgi:glycosyltransferase involved in cell wall biosynthesis